MGKEKSVDTSGSSESDLTSTTDDSEKGLFKLRREIGLVEGAAITVGSIIGSGIFISPKGVVESVGSVGLSLVVWVASGILSVIGAICYAELGTSFPDSGGEYHYLRLAFGDIPAFLFMWSSNVIFVPCNIAVLALSFSQYVLQPFFPTSSDTEIPESAVKLLAACAILLVIFINCYSVKVAAKIQNVFGIAKVLALLVIVVIGAVQFSKGKIENFENPFNESKYDAGNIALAFFSGIYAYGGSNSLNYVTEEVKNPTKTIPRALYLSMTIVIVFYLLVNACYFTVMTPAEMLASDAVAVTFGEKTIPAVTWVIPLFVAISTFGGLLINIMPFSRAVLAGGRTGHFPQVLSYVQVTQMTPMPALIFMAALSIAYLYTSNVVSLINYAGFMYAVVAVGTAAALLYLRWKEPTHYRPVKVLLLFPIVYLIVQLFLFVLPIYVAIIEAAIGCGILLSGLPVYYIFYYNGPKLHFVKSLTRSFTIFIQKLVLALPEEKEMENSKRIFSESTKL